MQPHRPLNMSCEHTHAHTHTHAHLTNHVSRAEEALTRFYTGVDALPSISDPLPLPLWLRLYLSLLYSEVGTHGRMYG